jgi:hypothetical protein
VEIRKNADLNINPLNSDTDEETVKSESGSNKKNIVARMCPSALLTAAA